MSHEKPWLEIEDLLEQRDVEGLSALVDDLSAGEAARALAHLSDNAQHDVLTMLPPDEAADLLEQLSRSQAVDLVEQLEPDEAARILTEMEYAAEADILRDLDETDAEQVLAALPAEEAAEARALAAWDDNEAGGLMGVELVSVPARATVGEAVEQLRAGQHDYRDYEVQYVYVVDEAGALVGVLRLRDLVLAPSDATADALMIRDPISVDVHTGLDELAEIFDGASFFGLPVTHEGRLVGVVRRAVVNEAVGEEAYRDHLKAAGIVGGEELRSMDLLPRAGRRLSWLSLNIGLNIVAASVIALYQDTLASVIALAVFLPIISDMSGCSGNQAVAVSMRELSLGVAEPRDFLHVWGKELQVGLLNGVVLGLLLGAAAWLWKGNPWLGLVAGGALALNTVVAVSIGGTTPLLLRGLGVDPALASGPVLTTITDLCGFLLVLGMATALLPYLL